MSIRESMDVRTDLERNLARTSWVRPGVPTTPPLLTAQTVKIWYLVHKWTSLLCTAFLILLCLTGLPLIFRDEIDLWLGNSIEPPELARELSLISLDRIVEAAMARHPTDAIRFISADDDGPVLFVGLGVTPDAKENSAVLKFDARTGEILQEVPLREGVMYVLLKLHVDLFAGLPGTLFLGFMGLMFLASVASGVVLYGPFMRRLPFGTVRRDRTPRLKWLDVHNLLGIVSLLWVVVVGATGVINTLAMPMFNLWQTTELADLTSPWRGRPVPTKLSSPQGALEISRAVEPGRELAFIAFPGTAFSSTHHYAVFMRGQTPLTERLIKPVLIEAESGGFTGTRDMPWYVTALRVSQPLHFGDYGGLPLKIIWGLLDIITLIVLVSGLYLWLKKGHVLFEEQFREDWGMDDGALVGTTGTTTPA